MDGIGAPGFSKDLFHWDNQKFFILFNNSCQIVIHPIVLMVAFSQNRLSLWRALVFKSNIFKNNFLNESLILFFESVLAMKKKKSH